MSQTVLDTGTGRASVDGVLDFAWDAGTFTATEAMRAASLTRSTAIEAIDTLIAAGVLQELPNARDAGEYRAGRPARRFCLRDDAGVVAALDAGDTHLTAAVSDLSGEVLLRRQIALSPAQRVDERRDTIVAHLRATLAEAGVARDDVLSLCVGVAAPVTLQGQSPPHPEGFWERTNPGLIDALGDEADVVEVKNDAQLAAAAEGTGGEAVGCRDYVALLAGERLGAGVVVDGHLLHGAHGGVGEMFAFDFIRDVDSAFGLGPTLERLAREAIAKAETETTERSGLAAMDPAQVHGRDVLELAAGGELQHVAAVHLCGIHGGESAALGRFGLRLGDGFAREAFESRSETERGIHIADEVEGEHLADTAVSAVQQVTVDHDAGPEALAGQQRDVVAASHRLAPGAFGCRRQLRVVLHFDDVGFVAQRIDQTRVRALPESLRVRR